MTIIKAYYDIYHPTYFADPYAFASNQIIMQASKNNKVYEQHLREFGMAEHLFFHEDELAIIQRGLKEIATAVPTKEILSQVEHFQHQVIAHETTWMQLTLLLKRIKSE